MSKGVRTAGAVLTALVLLAVSSSAAVAAAPAITSFTPTSGNAGAQLVVTGTGFTGTTSVQVGGKQAGFSVTSPTEISATVPSAPTTGKIRIVTPAGAVQSAALFTVTKLPPPTISFTPPSGSVGTTVTISGTGFTPAATVQFGGHDAVATFVSATDLTAVVPQGATTGKIRVTTAGGSVQSSALFTVLRMVPATTGFTPTSGTVRTSVVITGVGFTGATSVQFSGKEAAFTVDSDTQITATVPTAAATGRVRIATPTGAVQAPSLFTVIKVAPVVNSFSPDSGQAGTQVVITGTGFGAATHVQFGGVEATFTVNSTTEIVATVPVFAQTGTIRVVNPTGAGQSLSKFTVVVPTPAINYVLTALDQPQGVYTINGSGFTSVVTVTLAGKPVQSFTVDSDSQITFTAAKGTDFGTVTVTSAGGSDTGTDRVQLQWLPSFSPIIVARGRGEQIEFETVLSNVTSVTLSSQGGTVTALPVTSITPLPNGDYDIRVLVPANAFSGTVTIVSGGQTYTVPTFLTVVSGAAPIITDVEPIVGEPGHYTISGSFFTGTTSVTIAGVPVDDLASNGDDSHITFLAPTGSGSGPVVVTTPWGTATSTQTIPLQ